MHTVRFRQTCRCLHLQQSQAEGGEPSGQTGGLVTGEVEMQELLQDFQVLLQTTGSRGLLLPGAVVVVGFKVIDLEMVTGTTVMGEREREEVEGHSEADLIIKTLIVAAEVVVDLEEDGMDPEDLGVT